MSIPFHSLLANCKKESCSTFLRVLPKDAPFQLVLGEVILTNFALTFDLDTGSVRFNRLNNLWGRMYADKQSFGLLHKIWWFIHLFFKIILYMSAVSLLINAYFNRRKIYKWFGKRLGMSKSSTQPRSTGLAYSPAFSEDIDRPVLREPVHGDEHSKDFWQGEEV